MAEEVRAKVIHIVFVIGYLVSAQAMEAATLDNSFSPWWVPAGFVFVYLHLVGVRGYALAVATRSVSDWLIFDATEPDRVILSAMVIMAAWLFVTSITRRRGLSNAQLPDLGLFVLAGGIVGPVLASLGFEMVDVLYGASFGSWTDVSAFIIGDASGVMSTAPLLFLLNAARSGKTRKIAASMSLTQRLEIAVQALAASALPTFLIIAGPEGEVSPLLVLATLPVLWGAVRSEPLSTTLGIFLASSSISAAAVWHLGAGVELVEIQAMMLSTSFAALFVAAAIRTHAARKLEVRDSQDRWRELAEVSVDMAVLFDRDRQVLEVEGNAAGDVKLLDAVCKAVVSRLASDKGVGSTSTDFDWTATFGREFRQLRTRLRPVVSFDGKPGYLAVTWDISKNRAASPQQRRIDALDVATGLPGPLAIEEETARRLAELADVSGHVGVLVIEVDRLQVLLARAKPMAAEQMLRTIGTRLRDTVEFGDIPVRLSGDRFAIATRGFDEDHVRNTALRVRADLDGPIVVGDDRFDVITSIGAATTDDSAANAKALFGRAQAAASICRERPGSEPVVYDSAIEAAATERAQFAALMRSPQIADQLQMHYQPVVQTATGLVIGAEALVRWNHPELGLLGATRFVPIAEAEGLLPSLGAIILEKAARQAAEWANAGHKLKVAINVGASQLEELQCQLESVLKLTGCSPESLLLEITETQAVSDIETSREVLGKIRDLGVEILLDDFGQGWATLGMLRQLPFDGIKIDRQFVAGLPGNREDQAVVRLVNALGQNLNVDIVAEGVETKAQHQALIEIGVPHCQGWWFGRAVDPSEFPLPPVQST